MAKTKTLKGGTFNLLNSRPDLKVLREVAALLAKHDLDFLCIQEGVDYSKVLAQVPGYTLISDATTWQGRESVVLVRSSLPIDKVGTYTYGDGWFTLKKRRHAPTGQAEVRVAKWLIVRSLHLPTPSSWKNGELTGPVERKDDLIAAMEGLKEFFSFPCVRNARVAAGDWNEKPTTTGEFSPGWLQEETGAVAQATDSKQGHGHIDYPMVKGAAISDIWKDVWIDERSDHEPVIFELTKYSRFVMLMRNAAFARLKLREKRRARAARRRK